MKLLALTLLLANLAFVGWQYFIAAGPATPAGQKIDIPGLLLLSEVEITEDEKEDGEDEPEVLARVTPEPAKPGETVPAAETAATCATLGPFMNEQEADAVAGHLVDGGAAPLIRSEEAEVWFGFWVYIKPYPNRAAALAAGEALRQKGIKDLYVETDGEYRHGISLGVFRQRANAERVAGSVRPFGHKPDIIRRNRVEPVYWLEFEQTEGMDIDTAEYEAPPGQIIRLAVRDCPAPDATDSLAGAEPAT